MIREINANVIGHMRDERVRVASHACRACRWSYRERQKIKSRTVISKYNATTYIDYRNTRTVLDRATLRGVVHAPYASLA